MWVAGPQSSSNDFFKVSYFTQFENRTTEPGGWVSLLPFLLGSPNFHPSCSSPVTYSDIFSLGPTVNAALLKLEVNYPWKCLKAAFLQYHHIINSYYEESIPLCPLENAKTYQACVFSYLLLYNKLLQNLAMKTINIYLIVSVAQELRSSLTGWFSSSGSITRLQTS